MNSDFKSIYKQCLSHTCPPTQGNKEKAEGCYNQLNDFGKEPQEKNCMKCWYQELKNIFTEPEKQEEERSLFDEKLS